jgi:hypothetical protein
MAPGTDVVRLSRYQLFLLRRAVRVDTADLKHPARGDLLELLALLERATGASVRLVVSRAVQLPPRHARTEGRRPR